MNWKLRFLLWYVNNVQPLREDDPDDIVAERQKVMKVANLGKLLFDSKKEIREIRDFTIENIPVRLYRNHTNPEQKVIIYFHGGGFVLYNKDSHDYVARRLCAMNDCTVISVDYRLAPEFTFPAAHLDAFTVIEYVASHGVELGINSAKIIVAGDSAGGNLAACAAHHFKRKGNLAIAAQILIYPWVDGKLDTSSIEQYKNGFLLTKKGMQWFQKTYTPNPEDHCNPEVSPLYQDDFSNLPPCFILTAEYDPLKDDGKSYAAKLEQQNNVVLYKDYKALIHGFFNLPRLSSESMQAYYDIQAFITRVV